MLEQEEEHGRLWFLRTLGAGPHRITLLVRRRLTQRRRRILPGKGQLSRILRGQGRSRAHLHPILLGRRHLHLILRPRHRHLIQMTGITLGRQQQ